MCLLYLHYIIYLRCPLQFSPFQNLQASLPVAFSIWSCSILIFTISGCVPVWLLDFLVWLLNCLSIVLSTLCLVLFGVLYVLLDKWSCTILIIAISHSVLLCCSAYLNSLECMPLHCASTYLEYQPSWLHLAPWAIPLWLHCNYITTWLILWCKTLYHAISLALLFVQQRKEGKEL